MLIIGDARAQRFPEHPIRLIVGFPAGSAADVVARLTVQFLSERLGQQVFVENRPGAGSNIGTEAVVKAAPDGYTLLWIAASNATNTSLYRRLNFDFIRDIAPIAGVDTAAFVMVVNPLFPAQTLPEFIAFAKANPRKITMASAGVGSTPHIFGALFEMIAGVELVHVPYTGYYLPDLLSGQVQVAFSPIIVPLGYIKSGKLRALAVTSKVRADALPEIPAVSEFVPGYEAVGWVGVGAPKSTPPATIKKLNTEINAVLSEPAFEERLRALGAAPMRMTPADFGKFIADESDKWRKVIKFAGINPV